MSLYKNLIHPGNSHTYFLLWQTRYMTKIYDICIPTTSRVQPTLLSLRVGLHSVVEHLLQDIQIHVNLWFVGWDTRICSDIRSWPQLANITKPWIPAATNKSNPSLIKTLTFTEYQVFHGPGETRRSICSAKRATEFEQKIENFECKLLFGGMKNWWSLYRSAIVLSVQPEKISGAH